jgi:hypothetical protein
VNFDAAVGKKRKSLLDAEEALSSVHAGASGAGAAG